MTTKTPQTPWTPADRARLAELFKTHTAPQIAEIIGRGLSAVYAAASRYNIHKPAPTSPSMCAQILTLCSEPKGYQLGELAQRINKCTDTINTLAQLLCREGRLHKAGVRRFIRYFAHAQDAAAFALVAEAEHAQYLAASKAAKQAARNLARRKVTEAKPPQPPKARKVRRKAEAPPCQRSTAKVVSTPAKPANVIWPEHVQVQRIPTPAPRFAFEPHAGWRGQITSDWMDRRLAGSTR